MGEFSSSINVLVVGGGPAGSTAAAMLAKNGIDVVPLEGTTGLTDVKDASGGIGAVETGALMAEVGVMRGTSAKFTTSYMGGIDMSPVWNIWRDPLGPDVSMGDISIKAEPRLGLYRNATASLYGGSDGR